MLSFCLQNCDLTFFNIQTKITHFVIFNIGIIIYTYCKVKIVLYVSYCLKYCKQNNSELQLMLFFTM